jgi:hypothetical protein
MKAVSESIRNPDRRNHLTRRAALQSTAAIGALALPAGAAVAATAPAFGDVDSGFAAIEAGYRRWQELRAERDRLEDLAADLDARADAMVKPLIGPHLMPDPGIVDYVPRHYLPEWQPGGKVLEGAPQDVIEAAQQYIDWVTDWRDRRDALLDEVPECQQACELSTKAEKLRDDADAVRKDVLAIPTTTLRGIQIKLAIAVEARSLDAIEDATPDDFAYGGETLLPVLAADLRAMVGRAPA